VHAEHGHVDCIAYKKGGWEVDEPA
jgi:hypothetical protein